MSRSGLNYVRLSSGCGEAVLADGWVRVRRYGVPGAWVTWDVLFGKGPGTYELRYSTALVAEGLALSLEEMVRGAQVEARRAVGKEIAEWMKKWSADDLFDAGSEAKKDLPPGVSVCRDHWGESRTVEEVLAARRIPGSGCCYRYCDNMGCDCLEKAEKLQRTKNLLLTRTGNPSGYNICQDPDCDNPNGKH